VRRPWQKLEEHVRRLDDTPADRDLHEVRIRTKRVRYAAEAATPVVGRPARAFAKAAAGLQEVLGELNDAVVAAAWLDAQRGNADPATTRAAGAMAAVERADAASRRVEWHAAWEALAEPELRAWM
jgi:CHAD domain-containing protein